MKLARPSMPLSVKLDAALYALGLEPGNVDWHHEPSLGIRPYDPETGKWIPDANDPRHIVPLAKDTHKTQTTVDRKAIDKTRRNGEAEQAFRTRLLAKDTGDDVRDVKRHRIQSRGFQRRQS